MTTHNANNERIKRKYFAYLKEAQRHSEPTVDAAANSPWRKWRVFCKADDIAGYAILPSTSQGTRRAGFRRADSGLSDPGRVNRRTKQACQSGFSALAACPRPATGAGSGSG